MASTSTILVTGGTGFLGRHLVRQLRNQGAGVRVLCRSMRQAMALFGPDVELVAGDLNDSQAVMEACRGMQQVFHLGGFYQFGARHRRELWQTNVVGTRHVLAGCWQARVERVIHCSTAGVLAADARLLTERDFPARPPTGGGYKAAKWHAEQEALQAAAAGLPVVIASPTAPIGPGDARPTPTGRMVLDVLRRRFPACSRTGLNLVAVEDVAAGLVAASQHGETGQRYVLGNVNLWLTDFLGQVAVQAKVPPPGPVIPWPLLVLGGALGDLAELALGVGGGRLCWETACFARKRQFFDLTLSREVLGWQPKKPLTDAIADAVAWFTEQAAARDAAVPAPCATAS